MSDREQMDENAVKQEGVPESRAADKKEEEYISRLKYLQADFENYRKRTIKELKEIEDTSQRRLVASLLSTLDELGLAVENAHKAGHQGELVDGLEMIRKKLMATLEGDGLSRIESVGTPFDPALHEAVEKTQGTAARVDTVKEEMRPGYTFRGKVIRPSMVKVELAMKAPAEQEEKKDE